MEALFTFLETDEEYIANQGDIDQIIKLFNQYYNIKDESELDRSNSFLNFVNRASESRKKANKQSLTTVGACSEAINHVLISQQ